MNKKLIFGFPIHQDSNSAVDLYNSIKKFYGDHFVFYSSDNDKLDINEPGLTKIKPKRTYEWGHAHNFLFDAFEYIDELDFDYFIKLDSDCLIANEGLYELLEKNFDFSLDNYKNQHDWIHGWVFQKHINKYKNIINEIGIKRRDDNLVGSITAFCIFSKQAVQFIKKNIDKIEQSEDYKQLMKLKGLCMDETLTFNILKDAGFASLIGNEGDEWNLVEGVRYRPYWTVDELKNQPKEKFSIVYHPVLRDKTDPLRIYLKEKLEI